jgi:hypothetical protein
VWAEPLFAESKDWHKMRRFRLRRLEKVNIEALLVASGQNVKRLLDFGGRRLKKLAQAATLRPPIATSRKIGIIRKHRSLYSWRPTRVFFKWLGPFWNTPTSLKTAFCAYQSVSTFRSTKRPELRFRALLTDSTQEVRFEQVSAG